MVHFLTQPAIEAVILTAILGALGWIGRQYWKSHRGRKGPRKSKNSLLHQLPPPPTNFTGRDNELAELEHELASAQKRSTVISGQYVALQGMAGVGKTALATVLAHKLRERYADAQLYLNLRGTDLEHRPPVEPAQVMQSIILALRPEARPPKELDQLVPIYQGVLNETGRVLLLFDNVADSEQVKPLLPPANCLLLLTSRTQFSLPGMTVCNIDCLPPEKSRELILKLAPRIKGYEQTATELCGHLPLALEIVAGVVNDDKLYPVTELLQRFRKQTDKLTKLDAMLQATYDLLADDDRHRWASLAVFPVSFDLAAAATVWNENLNSARAGLQALVNANLVQWNETNDRFRLHDLVRNFCNRNLTEDERTAAKLRYAKHYQGVAVAANQLYLRGDGNALAGLELFDRERTHLETMFEFLSLSLKSHRKDQQIEPHKSVTDAAGSLVKLLDIMHDTVGIRFHARQRIIWLENQLLASRLIKDRIAECKSLGYLGLAYFELGNSQKAIGFYNQVLSISREINYRPGQAGALANLGLAHHHLGEHDDAIKFDEQALTIAREMDDRRNQAAGLNNLAEGYKQLGDHHRAIELFENALSLCREIGNKRLEAIILTNLGVECSFLDDIRNAITFYEQSLAISREIRDRYAEGMVLVSLGMAYAELEDFSGAIEFYKRALQSHREIGNLGGEANVLCCYAISLNELGDRTQAIALAEKSLSICEAIEDPNTEVVRGNLAKWRAVEREHDLS